MKIKQDISIGKNLRILRTSSKLSQKDVARELQLYGCNTSRDIYAQMEIGNYSIRISELIVLKKSFNVNLLTSSQTYQHQK